MSTPENTCAVLFLDVDGVLNRCGKSDTLLMPALLARLARIVEASKCTIVLSSSWRYFPTSLGKLMAALDALGLSIHSHTPDNTKLQPSGIYTSPPRGGEIQAWMDANWTPESFVILDDNSDMGHLMPHLIKTDSYTGLTDEIADRVIDALMTPTPT